MADSRSRQAGFTLIELLVVITIIGMLATVILGSMSTARAKSRDARRQADIAQLRNALELYYSDNKQYPLSGGASAPNSGWSNSNDGSWNTLQTALTPYITKIPTDPRQSASGWAGTGANTYAYYSLGYGCEQQWYMIVWYPETPNVLSPGVTTCDGTTFNYSGTVTVGMGK